MPRTITAMKAVRIGIAQPSLDQHDEYIIERGESPWRLSSPSSLNNPMKRRDGT